MKTQNYNSLFLLVILFCVNTSTSSQSSNSDNNYHIRLKESFVHPGILHSQASLNHIFEVASKKTMPEYGSYELLKKSSMLQCSIQDEWSL